LNELARLERNVLKLKITNLATDRIRDLDRRKVNWKVLRSFPWDAGVGGAEA